MAKSDLIEYTSQAAYDLLKKGNDEVLRGISLIEDFNKKTLGAKTPSGSDSAIKSLNEQLEKQGLLIQEQQKKLLNYAETQQRVADRNIKAAERQRLAEIKLAQDREKAFDRADKSLQKEAVAIEKAANAYNKIQSKVNAIVPEYQNLAAKRELGVKLTEREINRLDFLTGKLNAYQNILKKVDADMGRHNREVGNYAKANSNLSNSIGQISRELPNFGQSFSVGVLSLTNNIGALIDGIKQVKTQNAELRSQGKNTSSVFSQLLSSILSWQTALFIGIGIFSAYSKEIGEWVSNLWNGSRALNAIEKATVGAYEAQQRFNNTTAEALQNAQKELDKYAMLRNVIQDQTKSMDERLNAADRLIKAYPGYLAQFSKEQIVAAESGKAIKGYLDVNLSLLAALKQRASAEAKMGAANNNLKVASELQEEFLRREAINSEINKGIIAYDKWKKRIEDDIDLKNDDDDFVARFGKIEQDALGAYDAKGINELKLRFNAILKEYQREKNELRKAFLDTSLLDFSKERASGSGGRKYDPDAAILAARIRFLKEASELNEVEYQGQKKLKEKEIDDLDKLAKDEKRSFQDRITAYGEMLQAREELLMADLARQKNQQKEREEIEISEADKAYRSELKMAGPNAKAIAKITEYWEAEKDKIRIKHNEIRLQSDEENSREIQKIAEETAKAEIEILNRLRETQDKTDKNYRDGQIRIFSDIANNSKLSLQVRQAAFNASVALQRKELDLLKIRELADAGDNDAKIAEIKSRYEELNRALDQTAAKTNPFTVAVEASNKSLKDLSLTLASDVFSGAGFSSLTKFFDGSFKSLIEGIDLIEDKTESSLKKFSAYFNAVTEVFQEAVNVISQINQQAFDAQYARLEKQKDIAIAFAGDSTAAREEIEQEYEKRRLAIAREQAKSQKEAAIFNAIVNVAQGVTAALATGPAGIALAVVIGALGAAQIALIASQPLPEFYKGTDNAPEGWAWTQERGREIITDKEGRVKSTGSSGGRKKTWLDKGDKVYTASETKFILSEYSAFNQDLNSIMQSNNIGSAPIVQVVNSGATASEIGREMERVMKNRPNLNLNIDKDGFSTSLIKQGNKINYINNRVSGKADTV